MGQLVVTDVQCDQIVPRLYNHSADNQMRCHRHVIVCTLTYTPIGSEFRHSNETPRIYSVGGVHCLLKERGREME